ncbi:MAG: M16 family metallopeptidase [Candidatus Kapaibacterium sp.]
MKRFRNYAGMIFAIALLAFTGRGMSAAETDYNPVEFVRDSLPNGLQIIYHIDRSAPVVATVVHYKVGSHNEIPGKTGYAHFFEHLMFEGTEDIPRASMDRYVQEAGGMLNAGTSFDQTVYYFQVPSHQIKLPLWIESQRMRKLLVDSIGVETQRGVVLEELKMRTENNPYGTMLNKICENLFPGSSYEWTPIGYAKDIEMATIQDFRNFYNTYYQPNNAVLVISGDFDINQARKYVREYFGIFDRAPEPRRGEMKFDEMKSSIVKDIEDEKAQLPGVFIGFRGPKMGTKDQFAMNLLMDILATGESSRLYQRLVDKEQVAVQSAAMALDLEYAGLILFIGIASPGQDYEDIRELIFEEIDKMLENGVTDEEFEKAKNLAEVQFISGKKEVMNKGQELAKYQAYFGSPDRINTELKYYTEITKEDLIEVAKKYLDTDKFVVLNYLPKK